MKILLTGGAGFIGSSLAEALIEREHELLILDNLDNPKRCDTKLRNLDSIREKGDFRFVRGDIRDKETLASVFSEFEPEKVVHLAAIAGVRASLKNPGLYSDVNVTGTGNLLELAKHFQTDQLIFASSSSVYGSSTTLPFREDDRSGLLLSPYAITKKTGEDLCALFSSENNLSIVCLRFFTVYGPRQREEMAIHKFTRLIEAGEKIPVFHYGQSARDYTFINDVVQGILSSLEYNGDFEIFNLGSANPFRLLDLIAEIERALGKKAEIDLLPPQPGDVAVTFADISKARLKLGFTPQTEITEGIAQFVDWFHSAK